MSASSRNVRLSALTALGCLLLAGWFTGCALVSHLRLPTSSTESTGETLHMADDGYADITGVIHIHTTYSHDAHGTFADVVRVANAQGLQYVILTEHNNLRALRDGRQGWHGAVLALIGTELSTRSGHYLAMNVTEEINREHLTPQQIIDEANRQGGFGFLAHPFFAKARWTDYDVTGYTGIEIYNVAHDTIDENKLRLAMWTLMTPMEPFYMSIIDRPYDPLRMWDELIAKRGPTVGIGAADAHEFHTLGVKFAPYEDLFQLVRTHLLLPAGAAIEPATIYDALRRGHAYVSVHLVADARGCAFFAQRGEQAVAIMGDAVEWTPNLLLMAVVPAAGHMTLYKDGLAVSTYTGRLWQLPVTEPGAYRIEVSRFNKPWIFFNPIYVRAPTPKPEVPPDATDVAPPMSPTDAPQAP